MVDRTHSIKIGSLWKRSSSNGGKSFFTKRNYRPRVFILTHQTLCFYSGNVNNVGASKGRIDIPAIRAVEFVDDNAFGLPHTFQVTHTSKKHGFQTVYITATDKTECAEWVTKLRKECQINVDMLMHYHSGAFVKTSWTCCVSRDKTALGCQPTYFLLTKSSSRYADLRRKDTLTRKPSLKQTPMHCSTENLHNIEDRPMSSCGVRPLQQQKPLPLMPSNSDLDMVHSVTIQNGGILSREELLAGRISPQIGERSPLVGGRGVPQRNSFAPSCSSNGTPSLYDEQNDGALPTVAAEYNPATPLKSSASSSSSVSSTPMVHKTSLASIGEPTADENLPPPIPPRSAVRMKRSPSPAPSHSLQKPPVPPRKESNRTTPNKAPHQPPPSIRPPLIPTVSLPSINQPEVTGSHDQSVRESPRRALQPSQSSPIALRKRKPITKPMITPRLAHNNPNMIQL